MNRSVDKGFDAEAFYEALVSTVQARGLTWKEVAAQTGVGTTTLARMGQGRRPDAASLAALSAWAGLNPGDFVESQNRAAEPEALAQISSLLRRDRRLNRAAAEAIDAMLRSAYERLRSAPEDEEVQIRALRGRRARRPERNEE